MLLLKTILIAGLIGGSTGVISHLLRNGKVLIFPKRKVRPKGIHLGFIADFLIGAAAAIFAVTYLVPDPEEMRTLIGVSILAKSNILAKLRELANVNKLLFLTLQQK
ncbi:MAG: DUF4257 domain-containing protein [Bacillota bacterium]